MQSIAHGEKQNIKSSRLCLVRCSLLFPCRKQTKVASKGFTVAANKGQFEWLKGKSALETTPDDLRRHSKINNIHFFVYISSIQCGFIYKIKYYILGHLLMFDFYSCLTNSCLIF